MIEYLTSVGTEGAIFGIMALGLNVIWGWSGDFDLAYYGYVALGAYITLVLTIGPPTPPSQYVLGLQLPYPVAVLGAVAASSLLGLVVGLIALRHLRGIYFSIVTLGAVYVLYVMAGQYVPSLQRLQRALGTDRSHGRRPGPRLPDLPILLPGALPRPLCPRLRTHGPPLEQQVRARAAGAARGRAGGRGLRSRHLSEQAQGLRVRRRRCRVRWRSLRRLSQRVQPVRLGADRGHRPLLRRAGGGAETSAGSYSACFLVIVVLQESTRFLPEVPNHPNIVLALREILIGAILVLFLRFRPQGLLPERRFEDRTALEGASDPADASAQAMGS